MNFKNQIYDAIKYTLKDWKTIILLGIILCTLPVIIETETNYLLIAAILFFVSVILTLFEEGYRYEIIKETIKGNNNPPSIGNIKLLLKEGAYETIIIVIYWGIIFLLNKMAEYMNQINIFNWPLWVVLSVMCIIVYFLFFGATVNKALHNDRFISALNFIEIGKFYLKIGVKRTVVLIIVGIISINFIEISVMGIGIHNFAKIMDILINLTISPIMLLFMTRLTALIGREITYD